MTKDKDRLEGKMPLIIILALVFFLSIMPLLSRKTLKSQKTPPVSKKPASQLDNVKRKPSPTPTTVIPPISREFDEGPDDSAMHDLKRALDNIYQGKAEHNLKEGEVSYYEYGESGNYGIIAYLYEEGKTKIPSGYEGFSWERDLKNEVNQFLRLKEGEQMANFYFGIGEGYDIKTTLKKIGIRNYAVVDESFAPAGTWQRYYYTYDRNTQQLIYVYLIFYSIREDVGATYNKEGYLTSVEYPPEVDTFFRTFEERVLF